MFKFKLSYVALAAAMTSSFVYADPNTYNLRSGTQVVDIEAPNAAGVSHNVYREFNVSDKGMILNNSGSNYNSSQGSIAKNNNLANGSASVILNEVISNKASQLYGFIEVGGQKADVIVANPNGINCSGCNFINTNKAVLTTGTVKLSDTGAINSYNITGGKIMVDPYGMNVANGYAVLLADAINLSGTVTAANAILSTGNATFDNTTGKITSAGKSANLKQMLLPEYSLDISQLGGVKANNITMVGNNLGFGVRNKGAVVASGMLSMTSNGSLLNEGSITNNGMVTQIMSAGEMKNSGTMSNAYVAMLSSQKGLINEGTISSNNQLILSAAGDITNTSYSTLKANNALAVTTNGNLKTEFGSNMLSDNQLAVSAAGNITHGGGMAGKYTSISFGGNSLKVTGYAHGGNQLVVQSVKDGNLSSGEIFNDGTLQGGDVIVQTNGTLAMAKGSNIDASYNLSTQSNWLNNKGSMGSTAANVNIQSKDIDNYGNIDGATVKVVTNGELYNEGMIRSKGDMTLSTQNKGNIVNRGQVTAGKTLTLTAKQVENGGYGCGFLKLSKCGVGTLAADTLILNSSHKYASNMGGTQNFKKSEVNTVK